MPGVVVFGISFGFPELSRCDGQIAHVLLTRSPLVYPRRGLTARLACVKHAASVRPEPGSNSPLKSSDVSLSAPHRLFRVSRQELLRLEKSRQPSYLKESSTDIEELNAPRNLPTGVTN